jgi:tripartite-type tricarboxylate transporter receptor subunit TctC
MGYVPRVDSPAEFTAFLREERAHWSEVAQAYGAKPSQ